jgi:hypothetical protein
LTVLWRRLFRARIEAEFRQAFESGKIDALGLGRRIEALGRTEFEEACAVLRQDCLLLPPVSDPDVYSVFAAVFLDLTFSEPTALSTIFPAIESPVSIESVLTQDVDGRALFEATRLAGALEPSPPAKETGELEFSLEMPAVDELRKEQVGVRIPSRRLADQARSAAEHGNSVRAAILWTQAARRAGPESGQAERTAARAALRRLAVRLRKALFVRKGETRHWVESLNPLLPRAASEFWSPERRLLYDLQSVCIDHEREMFRLDPVGWLVSLGRSPLKRPLPHLREVNMSKHLRSAAKRLCRVRLPHETRVRLDELLRSATRDAEQALRDRFRPWVDSTLESEWVRPANLPERVAFRKLVDELLDPIVVRGFTTLADLRDACSRGQLKLPDLGGPVEFFMGDRLLRADRALAEVLEGVHRRGEVYLRWLQRFSSLAFGTPVGRFLTLYLVLPFGGAFVLLKGLQEINDVMIARLTGVHLNLTNAPSVLFLGTLALGTINYVRFRRGFVTTLIAIGWAFRTALLDLPKRLLTHPFLRRLIQSPTVLAFWRFFIEPGLVAVPFCALAWLVGYGLAAACAVGLTAFLAMSFLINTRTGRRFEEIATERISRAWHRMVFAVIPGLFRIIISAFDRLREWVEKLMYAVDEWLRFREGQSRAVLAIKAVSGLIWSAVAYTARIYINLLVEPELNPIKHFPVVTVAAKIMLPFALTLTRVLSAPLMPLLGPVISNVVVATTVFFLPGVFGFLFWELQSNWRLYVANRPHSLGPVVVGSHGETVIQLLRPGFHSGTLPKLFTRLRRTRQAGRKRAQLNQRAALNHVEESIRRLVERDFAALLHESCLLGHWLIELGGIHLATNRIRIELLSAERDRMCLWIDLEERSGILAAGVSEPGWIENLTAEERRSLSIAVVGLYKLSCVELIHTPGSPLPVSPAEPVFVGADRLSQSPVNFADIAIPWRAWVQAWQGEASESAATADPIWRNGALPGPVSLPNR